jgi:hypothetical protein
VQWSFDDNVVLIPCTICLMDIIGHVASTSYPRFAGYGKGVNKGCEESVTHSFLILTPFLREDYKMVFWDSSDRIELGKIPALTLYKDADAVGRRSRLPQLVCKGKPCNFYQPEVVRCTRLPGGSGTNIDWKVRADGWSEHRIRYILPFSARQIFQNPYDLEESRLAAKDGLDPGIHTWRRVRIHGMPHT